ncbi:MAG: polyketide synthase, partial [Myxococcota bacterium]
MHDRARDDRSIAIIGVGLRLPGGIRDLDAFWQALDDGRDLVGPAPADRDDPDLGPGAYLDDVAHFDAAFFGIAPREAEEMDPAQRLLLDTAHEALERAAQPVRALDRSATGVYVGLGLSDYGRRHFLSSDPSRLTPWSGTGAMLSVAAGRISYALGLQGPAMTVDTACSSSLVAVHLAVQALRDGTVDLALAGGANVVLSAVPSAYFAELGALANDGRCKTFAADADGYGRGEGAGMVALKRLSDALRDGDPIVGVIRGSAVNQDGRSNGLTAPSGRAQQAVVRQALTDAQLSPTDIGYVEAHGTGTPLGDPIEIDALRAVFGDREAPLTVGSVKTIGLH